MQLEFRDRDVRAAMRELAEASGQFDLATTGGLPETQPVGSGSRLMVVIEPLDWNDESPFDDDDGPAMIRNATVKVTIVAVAEDPTERDSEAERLLNLLCNLWNGVSLAGLTFPDLTRFTYTRSLAVKDMERRFESKFIYSYKVGGFRDFGVNE